MGAGTSGLCRSSDAPQTGDGSKKASNGHGAERTSSWSSETDGKIPAADLTRDQAADASSSPTSTGHTPPGALHLLARIQCDSDFKITGCDRGARSALGYEDHDLVGQSVVVLMSPLVAKVHSKMFRSMKNLPLSRRRALSQKLKYDMSNCRDFVVLDKQQNPVMCGISISLNDDMTSQLDLLQVESKVLHSIPVGYEQLINQPAQLEVQSYSEVICIMIDIAGSTQYATSVETDEMAQLMHNVYKAVHHAILSEIFPYAFILEICGDSLLLIVNASFMVRCPSEAAVIAMHAATTSQIHLDKVLGEYSPNMYARVGVAMGDVSAGVIDGRSFRVFGNTVLLSQRLEGACSRGRIACSLPFLNMLDTQQEFVQNMAGLGLKHHEQELTGFGNVAYGELASQRCYRLLTNSGRISMFIVR